jgi:hypothetical protein
MLMPRVYISDVIRIILVFIHDIFAAALVKQRRSTLSYLDTSNAAIDNNTDFLDKETNIMGL